MKSFKIVLYALCIATFVGCKDDITDPNKQITKISTGSGVIKGNVRLLANWEQTVKKIHPAVWSDMSGTTIQLLNNSTTTLTDKNGDFILAGVDSGMHTIVISRVGYETVNIPEQDHNGIDTVLMSVRIKDTTGFSKDANYSYMYIFEKSIIGKVEKIDAVCEEKIRIDTLYDHGKINRIVIDSTYNFQANVELVVEHPFDFTRQNKPIGYFAKISDKSTIDISEFPKDGNSTSFIKQWENKGFWGNPNSYGVNNDNRKYKIVSRIPKESNEHHFGTMKNYVKRFGKNLFLHVIPIWEADYRFIYNPIGQEYPTYEYSSKLFSGDLITIPIEWK